MEAACEQEALAPTISSPAATDLAPARLSGGIGAIDIRAPAGYASAWSAGEGTHCTARLLRKPRGWCVLATEMMNAKIARAAAQQPTRRGNRRPSRNASTPRPI